MSLLPAIRYEIELNQPLQATEFTAVEGSDFEIVLSIKRCGELQDLTGAVPSISIADSGETWTRTFSGTAGVANDKTLTIPIEGDNLDNNGTMSFMIQVVDADDNDIVWRRGSFVIYPKVPQSVTPPTGLLLDWGLYGTYANAGTAGPYRAGTNVNFASNADGSVNINSTASVSYAVGGNTTIDWSTTNVSSLTLAFNSTYTFTNIVAGKTYSLHVDQQAGWGINWPTEVTWVGGTPGPPSFGDNLYYFVAVSDSVVYGYEMN